MKVAKWKAPGKVVQLQAVGVGLYALDEDGGIWWRAGYEEWHRVETPRAQAQRQRKAALDRQRRRAR